MAYLRSRVEAAGGFGTLMQVVAAQECRVQRIRFSGAFKSTDVAGWTGLWMRVDGQVRKDTAAFDNMEDRALTGTTQLARYGVVLDVAEATAAILFGTTLTGRGEVRIAALRFEAVCTDVPTRGRDGARVVPTDLDSCDE